MTTTKIGDVMGSISRLAFQQMLARLEASNSRISRVAKAPDSVEEEADLHAQIIDYCRSKGWGYIHGRMDRRSTVTEGSPDFVICADSGRVFFVEAKSKDGKVSVKQQAWIAQAKRNGHTVHVLRSVQELNDIIFQKHLPMAGDSDAVKTP
jgi:hypothetical protein